MKKRISIRAAGALCGVAMLVLSGCSGSSTSSASNSSGAGQMQEVRQEQNGPSFASLMHGQYGPVESVEVQLPEDLKKVMGAEADEIIVEKFKITGHPLESAKYCAVDIETTFTEAGSPERIAEDARKVLERKELDVWLGGGASMGSNGESRLFGAFLSCIEKGLHSYTQSRAYDLEELRDIVNEGGSDAEEVLKIFNAYEVDFNQLVADFDAKRVAVHEEVAKVPLPNMFASLEVLGAGWIGIWGEAKPFADFSDASPERGVYVSEDGVKTIVVGDCARQTDSESQKVEFLGKGEVADVGYSVRSDGMVTITGASVKRYELDPAGNWLEKKI